MFMVILTHVADVYFVRMSETPNVIVYLFEGISHCAVPVFLMLTGAFLIDKMQNESSKDFYIKSFKKLGIPTIVFAVIYWIYDYIFGIKSITEIIITVVKGFLGFYAHWYVIMLAGIYAILPVISIIKQNVDKKSWECMVCAYFVWSILSRWMDNAGATWTTGLVFSFLGYVLIGDVLKHKKWKMSNLKGLGLFLVANAILLVNFYMIYILVTQGGNYHNKILNGYGAPAIAIASVLIFSAFSKMTFKVKASHLASYSFLIFLCHKLIINIISPNVFGGLDEVMNSNLIFIIPIEVVITFVITYMVVFIGDKLVKRIFCKKANLS